MSISNTIESLIQEGNFEESNVNEIKLYIADDYYSGVSLRFDLMNNGQEVYCNNDGSYTQLFSVLEELFSKIIEFDHDFLNHEFKKDLKIEVGIGDKLLKLMLPDNLVTCLSYNLMQLELPDNNNLNKKLKL